MLSVLRRWTPSVAIAAAIAYFGGHALTGQNGLLAWTASKRQIASLEAELAATQQELALLEDRAARLREESLDLDYLDERARAVVGMGRRGDVVVPAAALGRGG